MTRRTVVVARPVALATAAIVVLAACSGGSSGKAHGAASSQHHAPGVTEPTTAPARTITVQPIVLTSDSASAKAAVTRVDVTMSAAAPSQSAVTVSGSTTTKTEWTAAAWDAVMAATLRLGTPCDGHRFTFRVSGPLDGTSASALLTVAVLALLRGDTLRAHVSLAGTVDPDGTVETVDGLSARVSAANGAGITLAIPPVRVAFRGNSGGTDLVPVPVADIDAAYRVMTGKALPLLSAAIASTPAVPTSAALVATTRTNTAAVQTDQRTIAELPAAVHDGLASILDGATAEIDRATALTRAGSAAGAFQLTREASTTAGAAAEAGTLVAGALPRGVSTFSNQVQADLAAGQTARNAQLAALDRMQPRTLADVSALLAAYGAATDSSELAGYAAALEAQFAALPASTS
ncbi:MAG TPA: S16 family serine protease, partial [Acidimicrobiia bacterium]